MLDQPCERILGPQEEGEQPVYVCILRKRPLEQAASTVWLVPDNELQVREARHLGCTPDGSALKHPASKLLIRSPIGNKDLSDRFQVLRKVRKRSGGWAGV